MRNFNTTAVNLRATLDDVDPLVDASKPVAVRLSPFFRNFRAAAADLVPTVRDLDKIIKDPGRDDDLVDLTRLQPRLKRIAIGPVQVNGQRRPGAFPEGATALADSLNELAFFRAYSPELTGWFDDFGHSGLTDANGGIGRIGTTFNTFSIGANDLPVIDLTGALAITGDDLVAAVHRQLQALPGLERAARARRLEPVRSIRPTPPARAVPSTATRASSRRGTDMRRLALILALLAGSVATLAATASGDDVKTYYIEMDNAFGLVNGSEVKVAGVAAGTVSELLDQLGEARGRQGRADRPGRRPRRGHRLPDGAAVADRRVLHRLHAEGQPDRRGHGRCRLRMEDPDIPVEQTQQTVQQDLVFSTMRQPFRERLTLLINEFGTALAGNPENLNSAIRRGAPALTETKQIFNLLADQASLIRDLNVDSDEIIGKLAERRADVVDFIEEANDTAVASAERRDDLSQNFALLDDFLAELEPTMVELNNLAVQGTPLAADLRRAAPGLTTLSRNLPDFNRSATDAVVSLGKTSVTGQRALDKGRDEIDQLGRAAKNSFSTADNLAKFLRDIDDPRPRGRGGHPGERATPAARASRATPAWRACSTTSTTRRLRSTSTTRSGTSCTSRSSRSGPGPVDAYNAGEYDPDGPGPEEPEKGVPNADGSAATTNILEAHRCVAWLGDNQPGLNSGPNLPPYDPSVCPGGSNDLSLCDPAGARTKPEGRSGGLGRRGRGRHHRGADRAAHHRGADRAAHRGPDR